MKSFSSTSRKSIGLVLLGLSIIGVASGCQKIGSFVSSSSETSGTKSSGSGVFGKILATTKSGAATAGTILDCGGSQLLEVADKGDGTYGLVWKTTLTTGAAISCNYIGSISTKSVSTSVGGVFKKNTMTDALTLGADGTLSADCSKYLGDYAISETTQAGVSKINIGAPGDKLNITCGIASAPAPSSSPSSSPSTAPSATPAACNSTTVSHDQATKPAGNATLCDVGTASVVTENATKYTWTCTEGTGTPETCTAMKKIASAPVPSVAYCKTIGAIFSSSTNTCIGRGATAASGWIAVPGGTGFPAACMPAGVGFAYDCGITTGSGDGIACNATSHTLSCPDGTKPVTSDPVAGPYLPFGCSAYRTSTINISCQVMGLSYGGSASTCAGYFSTANGGTCFPSGEMVGGGWVVVPRDRETQCPPPAPKVTGSDTWGYNCKVVTGEADGISCTVLNGNVYDFACPTGTDLVDTGLRVPAPSPVPCSSGTRSTIFAYLACKAK